MRILRAYICRRVLKPLVLVFASFVVIYVLVDLFDHAHTFIDNRVPLRIVFLYYFYSTPLIFVLTAPVAVLLATLLSVGGMARSNELIAMKGAGLSLRKILSPVLGLALLVSLVTMVMGETILPPATRHRIAIEDDYIKRSRSDPTTRVDLIYVRPDGSMLLTRRYNTRRRLMEDVTVEEFDDNLRPTMRIDAESARWETDHWVLSSGRLRTFTATGEQTDPFDTYVLSYSEPTPDDLVRRDLEPEERGFFELRDYIAKLQATGNDPRALRVALNLKIAFPFVTFIMTLIGAPLAMGSRRTGFALAFTLALSTSFLYYGLIRVAQVLGGRGVLHPLLAAWSANILFAGIGLWIAARAPK